MSGRHIIAIMALAWLLALVSCGGDGSSPVIPTGEDPPDSNGTQIVSVTLSTGLWPAADGQGLVPEIAAGIGGATFIVTTEDSIYNVSASLAAGEPALVATLDLPAGKMGRIECQAEDIIKAVRYRAVVYRTLPTEAGTLVINLADANDATPPVMGGSLTSTVLSATEIDLEWDPATDGGDPSPVAAYLVWVVGGIAPAKSAELPWAAVPAGQTGLVLGGLTPGEHYEVSVQAIDPTGNTSVLSVYTAATLLTTAECYYVDVTVGTDSPTCGAFGSPCKTITQALANSSGEPIYIAAGTYSEATGESFPLVLKDGTRLAGTIQWPAGWRKTVIEVGTAESAIKVPISGSISGVKIDNSATGAAWLIDAYEGDVRIDWVVAEVYNSQHGIRCGARARIRNSVIRGHDVPGIGLSPRGVGLYGDESQSLIDCIIEDCAVAVAIQGRDKWVHQSLIRDCNTGISVWGYEPGETGDIQISRTVVMDCRDGIYLTNVDRTKLLYDTIYRSTQRGILISQVDNTTIIYSCHIDGSPVGAIVTNASPVIESSTLVCSDVNLHVRGTGLVQASGNRWDHNPPLVVVQEWEGPCADSDICYDRDYSGTPMPVWSPSFARTNCLSIGIVPHLPKQLPGFLKAVEEQVAAIRDEG
jgi:Protein of unknown function (DUF1565)